MRIFDVHSHIYPDKIAERAVESVSDFYQVHMQGKGTVKDLLLQQKKAGIFGSLVYAVAIKTSTVQSINDFIAEQTREHPSLIGFASMHQDFPDMEGEIERCIKMGLKGVKIHPDTQGVKADDPRLMHLYEILEGRLPVVMHCGDYRWDNSHPRRIKKILRAFPNLVMDAAHYGGWSLFDLAVEYLEDEHCFLDISSSSTLLGPRRVSELIHIYGPERMLFGSDYPMWDPTEEVGRFMESALTDEEREMICWQNAQRFLGMDLSNDLV